MSVYTSRKFSEVVEGNSYPGRGIIVGMTEDARYGVCAYFIMGRSSNSRNRVFVERDDALYTEAFDPSKLEDPSLIIYSPVKNIEGKLIVTNGNQTDTIYDGFVQNMTMQEALLSREFEPDAPNFTPRISAVAEAFTSGDFKYTMSILKSADEEGTACNRYNYEYEAVDGLGHFIHTYESDGNPLPTFQGEPRRIQIPDSIDEFADEIWNSLDEDNKISLYISYFNLVDESYEYKIINKNQ